MNGDTLVSPAQLVQKSYFAIANQGKILSGDIL